MIDYSQLTNAEIRMLVLKAMGYSVKRMPVYSGGPNWYWLYQNEQQYSRAFYATEAEAWSHAPDPLADANVYMGLVDEIENGYGASVKMRSYWTQNSEGLSEKQYVVTLLRPTHQEVFARSVSRARAVCEVYCMVKDSVPGGAER